MGKKKFLDQWSYQRAKTYDKLGGRWHFVIRTFVVKPGEDEPQEIYFRNDDKTEYGMLRFDRPQDNTYRDLKAIVNKIMNNRPFRAALLDDDTAVEWSKAWK